MELYRPLGITGFLIVITIGVIGFIVYSKRQKQIILPRDAKIIAKYIVLDEDLSPQVTKCEGEIKQFTDIMPEDCSFKLQNYEFDIEYKYVLNETGGLKEYWIYLPEGPLVYTEKDLLSDSSYMHSIGGDSLQIRISASGKEVLDNSDTIKIEKVWEKEKLIFVEARGEKGRRWIYAYE